uniref:Sm domain-containing protein n=1 Tax=Brassica oleracea var. oleracea TaxID=109376 RepID=A0A0D3D7T2_BRAOL
MLEDEVDDEGDIEALVVGFNRDEPKSGDTGEASGHVVTVELKSGELYRGSMIECEDNWNCQLEDITFTAMDAKVSQLEHIFIRGSKVRFMVIPDILKHAPMFKRLDARIKGKGGSLGVGRDRAAMRAGMLSYTVQLDIEIKIKGGPIRFRKAIGHLGILHLSLGISNIYNICCSMDSQTVQRMAALEAENELMDLEYNEDEDTAAPATGRGTRVRGAVPPVTR